MNKVHVVITRFNMGLYDKYNLKDAVEWMEHRLSLFEQYCLPSMQNQTNGNFIWTVLCDKRTPTLFQNKIRDYGKHCKQFTPIFAGSNGKFLVIRTAKQFNPEVLISTRFDNDDSLANNFVETIQNNQNTQNTFINLSKGYVLEAQMKRLYEFQSRSNSFITAIEPIKNAKTILGYGNHALLKISHPDKILNIEDERYWLQVIHDKNIMNKVRGTLVEVDNSITNKFRGIL